MAIIDQNWKMYKSLSLLILTLLLSGGVKAQLKDSLDYDSLTIVSTLVNETRKICVWTPPNYDSSTDSLPVLYMPDGGINEDFPHIAKTLAKLIKNKSIPPFILVGIENTERGRDLTGFSEEKKDGKYCPMTDGAKNFRAFITQELMPEINRRYRITDRKGIIGESLAGLFVMETFLIKPQTFDFYIAMDPSLWWNDHHLVRNSKAIFKQFPNNEVKLWFAGSSAKDISKHTKKLSKSFAKNAPDNIIVKYSNEPEEHHHTILKATKEKAIIWTINKNN